MITAELARESITVSNSAKTLTAAYLPPNTTYKTLYARIQVQDAPIRVRLDGTAPVAATSPGEVWQVGDIKEVWGHHDLNNLQMIRETSTDAVIAVSYHGGK